MISLPITVEIEELIAKLSFEEKESLALLIKAFVAKPVRSMPHVMDDMADYAKKKGLDTNTLDSLLTGE